MSAGVRPEPELEIVADCPAHCPNISKTPNAGGPYVAGTGETCCGLVMVAVMAAGTGAGMEVATERGAEAGGAVYEPNMLKTAGAGGAADIEAVDGTCSDFVMDGGTEAGSALNGPNISKTAGVSGAADVGAADGTCSDFGMGAGTEAGGAVVKPNMSKMPIAGREPDAAMGAGA